MQSQLLSLLLLLSAFAVHILAAPQDPVFEGEMQLRPEDVPTVFRATTATTATTTATTSATSTSATTHFYNKCPPGKKGTTPLCHLEGRRR